MAKNNATRVALFGLLIAIAVSIYLTTHHYDLKLGARDSKSFCTISTVIDCDSVNASVFSEIGPVSIALVGTMTYLAQLLLLLGVKAFDDDEKKKLTRYFLYLSTPGLITSIFLASVSTVILKSFCILCTSLHVLNFIIFGRAWIMVTEGNKFAHLKDDFLSLFKSGEKGGSRVLFLLVCIPLASILVHGMMNQNSDQIERIVQNSIADWQTAKKYDFFIEGAYQIGNPAAPFQIVEFSDFQCPHCKRAAPSLTAFANAHKDLVRASPFKIIH